MPVLFKGRLQYLLRSIGPFKPVTRSFDPSLRIASQDLPNNDPIFARHGSEWIPEQVAIAQGVDPASMYISWNTGNYQIGQNIEPLDPSITASIVRYGTCQDKLIHVAKGKSSVYSQLYSYQGLNNYTSGIIYHVKIKGLRPQTTYYYQCGDPSKDAMSEIFSFTTLPAPATGYPCKIAIVGHLGLTYSFMKDGALALLAYSADLPPLAAFATIALGNVQVNTLSTLAPGSVLEMRLTTGDKLSGSNTILRYLARISKLESLYGTDAVTASQVDEWVDFLPRLSNGAEFEGLCNHINSYLALRTFLVGYNITIADIGVWASLAASGQRWDSMHKSAKFPHVSRWYSSIMLEYPPLQELIMKYVGKRGLGKPVMESEVNSKTSKTEGSFDIDLPGAEVGKVCTRFPPEPSGYLHIGHAKAALLNQLFAEKYRGQLIIRFDDTNPAKEKDEFVQSILNDLDTLGVKGDKITYTSDYFPQLLQMAEKLIREGKAYVDDTPREQMQKERMDGIESRCRSNTFEENMILWQEMLKGSERGKQCCLRGKLDMQAVNKTLRDPVYYRCNPISHNRVGDKYKVYPTYDFACPYVDSIEGVTHALRSSEYHDRNDQYYRVLEDMGVRKVHVWDFSRMNFVYTLLSKRKLQWFVDNGRVDGWDDPRFPTVQGICRRGLTVEALKQFILSQGASKNLNLMEWDKLWTINKKIIDPVCARHTAVFATGRVILALKDGPDLPIVRVIPRHKKYEGAGQKCTTFTKRIWLDRADAEAITEGEEVTLMDWGNAVVESVEKDNEGTITGLSGRLHLEGSVKTTKLKLTWLAEMPELIDLSLVEFDHLITKKKLEEEDDFLSVLNPVTKKEVHALGDPNMRNIKKGEIIQLERKGYYICDVPYIRQSKPVVLIAIPDGRQRAN